MSGLVPWGRVVTLGLVAALLAACAGGAEPSATSDPRITEEQASTMAERAFSALNDSDYAGWSADWSDAMKSAIGEEAFLGFREQLISDWGQFVRVQSVEQGPGQDEGFVRYVFDLEFERGVVPFAFAFREDGDKIEGAFLLEE